MDYGLIVYPMASHNQQILLILMIVVEQNSLHDLRKIFGGCCRERTEWLSWLPPLNFN